MTIQKAEPEISVVRIDDQVVDAVPVQATPLTNNTDGAQTSAPPPTSSPGYDDNGKQS